jgi:hypothetical protein
VTATRRTSRRQVTFDPDELEWELLAELNGWLNRLPVTEHRALRPIVEAEVRRRLRRHPRTWTDDGRRWVPIRSTREPLVPAQVTRAVAGVSHYQYPTAVGLAWAVSGIDSDVANRWRPDRARWQPTCHDEEEPSRFDVLDRARAWQAHLAPKTVDPQRPWLLDPGVLTRAADGLGSRRLLRDPGSLQPYLAAGFSREAAHAWHRLLTTRGLLDPCRASLPVAVAWRNAGVSLPNLQRWTAGSEPPACGRRYPIDWQAALLHVGCPDLVTALPWLHLVRDHRRITLQDVVDHYGTTPIDWLRAWA